MNDTAEVVLPRLTPARALLSMLPCFLFLYVNAVMFFALLRKPLFLESSRYILFGHLLFTDSLQLLMSMLLYVFAVTMTKMSCYVCIIFTLIANVTVKMSPLNLAVMSLERYVAICFPLRYVVIATTRTTGVAIAVMWSMASFDSFTQLFLFIRFTNTSFTTHCTKQALFKLEIYMTLNRSFTLMYFVLVSMIIIYSYIAIMVIVKTSAANVSHADKAHTTVLLHLLQLCLCLTSTLFNMVNSSGLWNIDTATAIHVQYALFLGLIVFPKCLSPLLYGLKDNNFRNVFKDCFTFGLRAKIKPFPK
ncbi:odorant receptor 131-2-like [Eucyclogobius newberryi]|uniref:odorant receptor 131-2-like n=1 Tax=Eucyclogobius newberryi TaxID=166745 RepID=UPI003B5970CD